jgi:hypothetical protein
MLFGGVLILPFIGPALCAARGEVWLTVLPSWLLSAAPSDQRLNSGRIKQQSPAQSGWLKAVNTYPLANRVDTDSTPVRHFNQGHQPLVVHLAPRLRLAVPCLSLCSSSFKSDDSRTMTRPPTLVRSSSPRRIHA